MFRFSRDKRFGSVSFDEFAKYAKDFTTAVAASRPSMSVKVFTAEDFETYRYTKITFYAQEVIDALKKRKTYTLETFDADAWKRSLQVQMIIGDSSDPEPFMLYVSIDKHEQPRRIVFYGQAFEDELQGKLLREFARRSAFYSIGDGYSKSSAFNFAFGLRLTGIRLPPGLP